jgi:hypothetical protein
MDTLMLLAVRGVPRKGVTPGSPCQQGGLEPVLWPGRGPVDSSRSPGRYNRGNHCGGKPTEWLTVAKADAPRSLRNALRFFDTPMRFQQVAILPIAF